MPSKSDLKRWMAAQRFTTAAAAKFLRVNQRTVQRWLQGTRRIPDWLENVIQGSSSGRTLGFDPGNARSNRAP